jgi:hypothetical protein
MENLILLLKRLNMPIPNDVLPAWGYPRYIWLMLLSVQMSWGKMTAEESSASYNLRWFEMLCTSKYKLETALVENYDNLSTGLQTHTYVVNMFEMVGRYLKYT